MAINIGKLPTASVKSKKSISISSFKTANKESALKAYNDSKTRIQRLNEEASKKNTLPTATKNDKLKKYGSILTNITSAVTNPLGYLSSKAAKVALPNAKETVNKVKNGEIKIISGTDNYKNVLSPLKDGYQFGDLAKTKNNIKNATIKTGASTGINLLKNFGTGAMKAVEGVVDTGLTAGVVLGKAGSLLTNKDSWYGKEVRNNINNLENLIKKDLTSEALDFYGWNKKLLSGKTVSETIDDSSLVTNKDLIGKASEGIGGMAPTIMTGGTNKILNSINFGSKVMGTAVEEALNNGADFNTAVAYGIGSTAVEIGSEWLTGGIPGIKGSAGGGLDKLASKLIGEDIDTASKTLTKAILKAGYKVFGEAGEEALAEFLAPYLKQFTYEYNKDKNILGNLSEATSKVSINDIIESAIVGAVTGGLLNLPMTMSDINQVKNQSGMNEQKVFNQDLVRNDSNNINTEENINPNQESIFPITTENNNSINANENIETQIEDKAVYLDRLQDLRAKTLDTIKQKELDKQISTLQSQINDLQAQLTPTNTNTIPDIESSKIVANNQQELDNSSFSMEQNTSTLQESDLNTLEGSATAFNIDKNTAEYKFAKALKDTKGIEVVFKDDVRTEKGEKIEALYNPFTRQIELDINSRNTVQNLVVHELTHALEGTSEYQKLQDFILSYAKSKALYDQAKQDLVKRYENTYKNDAEFDSKIDSEATASVLGNLLNDQEYLNHLAKTKPSVFKKLYAWLLEKYSKATGDEKAFLKAVKLKFEIAYSKAQESNSNGSNHISYAVIYNNDGTFNRVKINDNIFENNDGKSINQTIKEYLEQHIGEVYTIIESGQKIYLGEELPNEYVHSKSSSALPTASKLAKGRATSGIKQIIENATNRSWEPNKKEKHNADAKYGFYRYDTVFSFDYNGQEKVYTGTILIRNDADGKKYLYDILNIKAQKKLINLPPVASNSIKSSAMFGGSSNQLNDNISQSNTNVKSDTSSIKYSMQESKNNTQVDNKGRTLTKEQQEFFKDSKVRDENDNLMTHYNGSGEHTTYDPEKMSDMSKWGKGIYLSKYKEAASLYGNNIKEVYVNVTNPISRTEKTITFEQYSDLYKNLYDGETAYREEYDMYDNDMDLLWDITNKGSWADYADQIKKYTGKDGIIIEDYLMAENKIGELMTIAFQSNQVKNVDNTNPTSNEDIRYSKETNDNWSKFIKKEIEPINKNKVQSNFSDIRVLPKADTKKNTKKAKVLPTAETNNKSKTNAKSNENKKIRSWSKTITKSDLDEDIILEAMKEQDFTYIPQSNREQWDDATSKVQMRGYEKSIELFNNIFNSNKRFTSYDSALGQKLLQEASRRKDVEIFKDLLPKMTIIGTELGQAVQSLSIIKKLSPEGQLKYLQATVDNMKNKGVKGAEEINITNDMIETILNSENETELVENMDKVKQQIAEQLPTTFKEKVVAWRYLSMLGNPRTHFKNIVSNIAMAGTMNVKNIVARTIETAVNPIIKKAGQERTKTFKKSSQDVKDFVKDYSETAVDKLSNTSKYSMELEIKRAKKVFGDKGFGGFVQKVYDLNSKGLEFEDTLFKNARFKTAMAEYLTANGISTKTDIDNNQNLVNNAYLYAMEESLKATFQQYSALASTLSQLKHKNAGIEFVLDALIPFTKTPANILKTGASYSPLGLLKSISYDTMRLKNGKISITQYIDNISQGLTGTGIVLLGYTLAQSGLLKAGGDDDKEDKFDEALGNQSYSITIAGQTITLDWLSPVAMPLFVGAEISNMKENGVEKFDMNIATDMLTTTFDPLMEMSFMQGINNALSGFKENKIEGLITESIQSYISQLFPTLFGQITKTIDPVVRSTSTSKDSFWSPVEESIRSNMAKIPGLSYFLEPAVDVWGNKRERSKNIIVRAFENFIAPYNRKEKINDSVSDELQRMYEQTGEDSVIPTIYLKKTITYKGEDYQTSAKDYTILKETYGKTAANTLYELFETNTYKNSSEEEKVKLIKNVYTYSFDKAKQEYLKTKGVNYTNTTKDNIDIYRDNYIKNVVDDDISYASASYREQNPERYSAISNFNIKYDDYVKYQKEINEIKKTYQGDENKSVRKNKIHAYIDSLPYSSAQKTALYNLLGGYSIKGNQSQMKTYINGLKLSAKEKQEIWDIFYK